MSKMTTVEALRTCLYENGIEMLLDYPKLCGKLWDLAPAELLGRERFRAIYETGAVESIHEAVMDAAHYTDHFAKAMEKLCTREGMTVAACEETLMLFYDALGFPPKKPIENVQTVTEGDWKYTGEIKYGKPHGVGKEELLAYGIVCSSRDGQWLCGSPFGYFHSIDSLGVESYSFCIDGWTIGKETRIWSEDDIEVIDHGYDPDKVKPKKIADNKEQIHQSLVDALSAIATDRKDG